MNLSPRSTEIQCQPGTFGLQCERNCNCLDRTESCFVHSGGCPSGCAPNYTGEDCSELNCTVGTYGDDCKETCSVTCGGDDLIAASRRMEHVPRAVIQGTLAIIVSQSGEFPVCEWHPRPHPRSAPNLEELIRVVFVGQEEPPAPPP
ncbi:hypothetical protein RRG08_051475 [Elysia crispata]|uniref:EGF-like domain-containing protein n=1 Tax=Elysia crispata TaxID=231223 RepID=A0AAE1E8Q5_9GAST|nr:hypothetical protein RRG08_051475 [Elysia crispata]